MGKATKRRAFKIDAEAPPDAQLANGQFARDFVTHAETNTKAMAYTNRGGTPLARWEHGKKLDSTQLAVILSCLECWRLAGVSQRVTANYGERIRAANDTERNAAARLHARETLDRYESFFPGRTKTYFALFEDVIRHNTPAGIAGAVAGFDSKAAQNRALTVVKMVCDVIASHERF